MTYLFGTKKKKLLKDIIADSDVSFSKWAVLELINWKNTTRIKNCLKISGSNDKLLPASQDAISIKNGEHFMIVDRAGTGREGDEWTRFGPYLWLYAEKQRTQGKGFAQPTKRGMGLAN